MVLLVVVSPVLGNVWWRQILVFSNEAKDSVQGALISFFLAQWEFFGREVEMEGGE